MPPPGPAPASAAMQWIFSRPWLSLLLAAITFLVYIPSLHSDFYYPVPEASMRTGVTTMSSAVLNLLGK